MRGKLHKMPKTYKSHRNRFTVRREVSSVNLLIWICLYYSRNDTLTASPRSLWTLNFRPNPDLLNQSLCFSQEAWVSQRAYWSVRSHKPHDSEKVGSAWGGSPGESRGGWVWWALPSRILAVTWLAVKPPLPAALQGTWSLRGGPAADPGSLGRGRADHSPRPVPPAVSLGPGHPSAVRLLLATTADRDSATCGANVFPREPFPTSAATGCSLEAGLAGEPAGSRCGRHGQASAGSLGQARTGIGLWVENVPKGKASSLFWAWEGQC